MSRYVGPKSRIVRRLGKLPGLTQKISKKQQPPGKGGGLSAKAGGRKKEIPQYTKRLQEKQKLRYNYGITERQLVNYVRLARKGKDSSGAFLLKLLEMRLDNTIFRLGLAPTIGSARQIVNHGHILVNNRTVNIPSYRCKINDTIQIKNRPVSKDLIQNLAQEIRLPSHLRVQNQNLEKGDFLATVNAIVDRNDINIDINELLIIEYYSRKV
jgi:small subunit ribosomal protein S4